MEGGRWRQSLGTRKMSINRDEEKARGKLLAGIFQMHLQVGACVCAEVANPSRGNGGGGALEKMGWDRCWEAQEPCFVGTWALSRCERRHGQCWTLRGAARQVRASVTDGSLQERVSRDCPLVLNPAVGVGVGRKHTPSAHCPSPAWGLE